VNIYLPRAGASAIGNRANGGRVRRLFFTGFIRSVIRPDTRPYRYCGYSGISHHVIGLNGMTMIIGSRDVHYGCSYFDSKSFEIVRRSRTTCGRSNNVVVVQRHGCVYNSEKSYVPSLFARRINERIRQTRTVLNAVQTPREPSRRRLYK